MCLSFGSRREFAIYCGAKQDYWSKTEICFFGFSRRFWNFYPSFSSFSVLVSLSLSLFALFERKLAEEQDGKQNQATVSSRCAITSCVDSKYISRRSIKFLTNWYTFFCSKMNHLLFFQLNQLFSLCKSWFSWKKSNKKKQSFVWKLFFYLVFFLASTFS